MLKYPAVLDVKVLDLLYIFIHMLMRLGNSRLEQIPPYQGTHFIHMGEEEQTCDEFSAQKNPIFGAEF